MTDHASAPDARSTIIVASSLAAQQWEIHLTADAIRRDAHAWETPAVLTYAAWLEGLWRERPDGAQRALLTRAQSLALWRRVVAESEEGGELIGHAGAAEWAAAAWELLHRFEIDPGTLRAGAGQLDYRAFLGWCTHYRRRLEAHGWLDAAALEMSRAEHANGGAHDIVAADLADTYPARARLFAHLAANGARVLTLDAPVVTAGQRRAVRLADAAEELRTAFEWARRRLQRRPQSRVAVVVAGLAQRRDEVDRQLAQVFRGHGPDGTWSAAQSRAGDPAIGAAMTALTLLAQNSPYVTFGRWLRSPFFAASPAERIALAQLDTQLRTELRSQLPFATAYRRCGLREMLRARAPESANALDGALAEGGGTQRATPGRWAHAFSRYLTRLRWHAPAERGALLSWQAGLDELASLTAILGEISVEAALQELARTLDKPAQTKLPLYGVHVLGHVTSVGPGYDAVWVTGFTDAYWPEAPQVNPLVPLSVQRAHGMPHSSPEDAHDRSTRAFDGLRQRTSDLVVSWPSRVYDYETEPSPAIASWPELPAEDAATPSDRPPRARETVVDPAPPLAHTRLPGGASMLSRQALCPLRAFCQDRLGARALEPVGFGITPRLRGIATHDAAELLLRDLPTQSELTHRGAAAVAQCVDAALAKLFGPTREALHALLELETEQLRNVLLNLLQSEARRSPFRVRAVEQRSEIGLGRWTLRVRVDRIDELADGTIAIIDYKTGERATSSAWFAPRLRDAQVPLYAAQAQAQDLVGAAVIARLTPTETGYSGIWPDAAFPGRPHSAAHPQIAAQLTAWRTQLEQLAEEFAAGDTRVFLDGYDEAVAAYAPLTRIFELLGRPGGASARG